jgi:hypothetical protein
LKHFSNQDKVTSLLFRGEASGNAVPFTGSDNLAGRSRTGAGVSWNDVPAWSSGQVTQSPDPAPVVQEIVNRADWRSGNALAFFVSGSGKRAAVSYNQDPDAAPLLIVQFTAGNVNSAALDARAGQQNATTVYLPAAMR